MVFVLGIERSATTWVSNILDMHPNTELFMEPLSSNISRFKDWPSRFTEIEDKLEMAKYFWDEFAYIQEHKRFFLTRIIDTKWAWYSDIKMAHKLWSFSPVARDFFELNFHRREPGGYPSKEEKPVPIIKEVRLNFNVPIIKKIDPKAKVVVILRNYAANIQSIARQIDKGNLKELVQLLEESYGDTDIHAIFDFWADSYNRLLHDLDREGISYTIVKHEDLLTAGKEKVDQLFEFVGLRPSQFVYDYLTKSNTKGSGKHSTNRSHSEILRRNAKAEKELYPLLAGAIADRNWHGAIEDMVTNQ